MATSGPEALRTPRQDWRLELEEVAVCLTDAQYAGAQSLAEFMNSVARAAPHRRLRPRCRPQPGESPTRPTYSTALARPASAANTWSHDPGSTLSSDGMTSAWSRVVWRVVRAGVGARMWWLYAISAVQRDVRRTHLSWARLREAIGARKRYVTAYASWLQEGGAPGACPATRELDEQLPEPSIALFRSGRQGLG